MRLATLFLVGATLVAAVPFSASAAQIAPAQLQIESSSPLVQVDRRCGRYRHYVPRHRYRGRIIAGRCVADRRR